MDRNNGHEGHFPLCQPSDVGPVMLVSADDADVDSGGFWLILADSDQFWPMRMLQNGVCVGVQTTNPILIISLSLSRDSTTKLRPSVMTTTTTTIIIITFTVHWASSWQGHLHVRGTETTTDICIFAPNNKDVLSTKKEADNF